MSKSVEQMQRQIELMLNELGADLQVYRLVLQGVVRAIALDTSHPAEFLATFQARVEEILSAAAAPFGVETQDVQRSRALATARAERFFQEIHPTAPGDPDRKLS